MVRVCIPVALLASVLVAPAAAQNWWSNYKVGDRVMFSVSEREADLQPCIVVEADPQYGLRVQCQAFKHWGAGKYIVYHQNNLGGRAPAAAPQTPPTAAGGRAPVGGRNWWAGYAIGDKVMFSVSERKDDLQPCTVVEAHPDYGLRVQCQAFKHWAAGKYIVYNQNNLGGAPDPAPPTAGAGPKPAPAADPRATPPAATAGTGPLKPGEYACYGSGGTLLIGLGFKLAADGTYTDLEGGNRGRVTVSGGSVIFDGGTLGGKTGRRLDGSRFVLGYATTCEPW